MLVIQDWLTVFVLGFLVVMFPGPNFAMILRNSLLRSRRAGIYTALGIALGGTVHVTYSLIGIGVIISQSILLFNALKWLGAFYLIAIGLKALWTKKHPIQAANGPQARMSREAALRSGFLTCLLNPKSTLFFFALFGIPRSPRWLVRRGRQEEARQVLVRVGEQDVDREIQDIVATVSGEGSGRGVPLFQRRYSLPILLAVTIGMFNQLTGINAILYYLNDIFARAGFDKVSSDLQAVAIGFTNLVFTLIAMSLIDRLGRKKLLLVGALGTAACLAGVSFVFFTGLYQGMLLWLLVIFIAFFAFSQGSVIWVYLSEVFPNLVRAKGQSLGSFTHWFMNALISGVFPLMAARSGGIPFAFFTVMTVIQFFVVLLVYPETKGVSLEELERKMDKGHATVR